MNDIIAEVAEWAGTRLHAGGGTLGEVLVGKGPLPLPVDERTETRVEWPKVPADSVAAAY